jgi:hypothetical protein
MLFQTHTYNPKPLSTRRPAASTFHNQMMAQAARTTKVAQEVRVMEAGYILAI